MHIIELSLLAELFNTQPVIDSFGTLNKYSYWNCFVCNQVM